MRLAACRFVVAWIVAFGLLEGPARAGTSEAVDAVIGRVMRDLHVPGMGVALVRAGKVEKLATYGVANVEWQAAVTDDTRFQLASATKVFTGTLVMLLVQDGTLRLDDPIAKYLPEAPAAWRAITIAQLAAHASGIPEPAEPPRGTLADEAAALAKRPLAFAPGTQAVYGLSDYLVLAHVLEKATGRAFPELLQARVFAPLQLTCTAFDRATDAGPTRSADVIPRRASVYRWAGDHQRTAWFLYPEATYASGGLWSCLPDLAKWARAMDEGRLLTAESERIASTPYRLRDGREAPWGVVFSTGSLRGRRSYGHSGGPALADIVRLPELDVTVIVLANQQRLHPELAPLIASLLLPASATTPLADARPALTRTTRGLVDGLATGTLADTAFAPGVRAELVPALRDWGPVMMAPLGPTTSFALVDEQRAGAGSVRTYRAMHGAFAIRWTFTLDERGLVRDVEHRPD